MDERWIIETLELFHVSGRWVPNQTIFSIVDHRTIITSSQPKKGVRVREVVDTVKEFKMSSLEFKDFLNRSRKVRITQTDSPHYC